MNPCLGEDHPNVDPAPLVKGFPQFNIDDSLFDKKSYARAVKQTQYVASEIPNKLKLPLLQHSYNEHNVEVEDAERT